MTATINEIEKKSELKFPLLMKWDKDVIIATGKTDRGFIGTVVAGETESIGIWSDTWSSIHFTPVPLPCTITFNP